VLDSIARQDEDGPRDGETTIEQRLPDGASGVQGFEIGHLLPALAVTAGKKHAIRRDCRPVPQSLGQTRGIRTSCAELHTRKLPSGEGSNVAFSHGSATARIPIFIVARFLRRGGNLWYALFEKGIYPRFSFIAAYGDRGH
jgi:hypothetical protein